MPKFDDYTQKNAPEDNDITLILDKTANVNKKTPFSGVWNWIVSKLTSAVISQLETTNKSIVPAINELNSKSWAYNVLSDGDDLNECTTTTVYVSTSSSNKYLNAPSAIKNTFRMLVFPFNTSTNRMQVIISSSNYFCIRTQLSTGWNDWAIFNGSADN